MVDKVYVHQALNGTAHQILIWRSLAGARGRMSPPGYRLVSILHVRWKS